MWGWGSDNGLRPRHGFCSGLDLTQPGVYVIPFPKQTLPWALCEQHHRKFYLGTALLFGEPLGQAKHHPLLLGGFGAFEEVKGKVNVCVGEQWPQSLAVGIQTWMAPAGCGTRAQSYLWPTEGLWAHSRVWQVQLGCKSCSSVAVWVPWTAVGARPVTFVLGVLLAFLPSDDTNVQAVLL